MVVSYDRRGAAWPPGIPREEHEATANLGETRMGEHSGEDLRAITLHRSQLPGGGHRPNGRRGQRKSVLADVQPADVGTMGTVAQPVSPSHANTSHLSSAKVIGQKTLNLQRNTMNMSLNNVPESRSESHSKRTSPESSSNDLSLDSKTLVYKESEDQIRYRQPELPAMDSSAPIKSAGRPSGHPEDLGRVLQLWKRVQNLRFQVQEQRNLLQSKREAKSDADEQYIKRIRTMHVASPGPIKMDESEIKVLETLWRLCQVARDEYGPVEDALHSMEYRLEVEEAKLARAEERLYSQLNVQDSSSPITSLLQNEDEYEDEDKSSGQSSLASTHDYEPIYEDYLRRLGDQDILEESYEGLFNEKLMLEAEQEKRRRVGMDLDEQDLDFLARFTDDSEAMRKDLEEVLKDVERLRKLCIEEGVLDATGRPVQQPPGEETPKLEKGKGLAIDRQTYEHERPKLEMGRGPAIGRPTHEPPGDEGPKLEKGKGTQEELPSKHSKPSQLRATSGNNEADSRGIFSHPTYGGFINFWLLDKLRSSVMEIMLLATFVRAVLSNVESKDWQRAVLRLWWRDGAGTLYEATKLEAPAQISTEEQVEKSVGEQNGHTMTIAVRSLSLKSKLSWLSDFLHLGSGPRAKSNATF